MPKKTKETTKTVFVGFLDMNDDPFTALADGQGFVYETLEEAVKSAPGDLGLGDGDEFSIVKMTVSAIEAYKVVQSAKKVS